MSLELSPRLLTSTERLVAFLRENPDAVELLKTLKVTEYHWIATRPGHEPITGGRHGDFAQMREECEWILDGKIAWHGDNPFRDVERIDILDANGAHIWSKTRETP